MSSMTRDLVSRSSPVTAELQAIKALSEWLTTTEGQAAEDNDIRLWLQERGWPASKLKAWAERIATEQAMADPYHTDPFIIAQRLNQRFERLAFKAEENNDLKHAILATEAQAKLNRTGGFAPVAQQQLTLNITNSTAHLVSDDDLARIAKQAEVIPQPEIDEILT